MVQAKQLDRIETLNQFLATLTEQQLVSVQPFVLERASPMERYLVTYRAPDDK